jgi:hypothetical protein
VPRRLALIIVAVQSPRSFGPTRSACWWVLKMSSALRRLQRSAPTHLPDSIRAWHPSAKLVLALFRSHPPLEEHACPSGSHGCVTQLLASR